MARRRPRSARTRRRRPRRGPERLELRADRLELAGAACSRSRSWSNRCSCSSRSFAAAVVRATISWSICSCSGGGLRLGVVEPLADLERRPQLAGGVGDRQAVGGDLVLAPLGGGELDVVGGVLERLVPASSARFASWLSFACGRPPPSRSGAGRAARPQGARRRRRSSAARIGVRLNPPPDGSPRPSRRRRAARSRGGRHGAWQDRAGGRLAQGVGAGDRRAGEVAVGQVGLDASPRIASISSSVTSSSASPTQSASERSSTATRNSASLPPSDDVSAVLARRTTRPRRRSSRRTRRTAGCCPGGVQVVERLLDRRDVGVGQDVGLIRDPVRGARGSSAIASAGVGRRRASQGRARPGEATRRACVGPDGRRRQAHRHWIVP